MSKTRAPNPAPQVEQPTLKRSVVEQYSPRPSRPQQPEHRVVKEPTDVQKTAEPMDAYLEESRLPLTLTTNFAVLIEEVIPELIQRQKHGQIPTLIKNFLGNHLQLDALINPNVEVCYVRQHRTALAMLDALTKVPHTQEIASDYANKLKWS